MKKPPPKSPREKMPPPKSVIVSIYRDGSMNVSRFVNDLVCEGAVKTVRYDLHTPSVTPSERERDEIVKAAMDWFRTYFAGTTDSDVCVFDQKNAERVENRLGNACRRLSLRASRQPRRMKGGG